MSGHKKWREIRGPRTPEQEAETAIGVAAIRMGQRLDAIRRAQGMTQTDVARRMGASQSHVAQVEARDDVYLSTLASYIEALGGELRVQAVFPGDEVVEITLGRGADAPHTRVAGATG